MMTIIIALRTDRVLRYIIHSRQPTRLTYTHTVDTWWIDWTAVDIHTMTSKRIHLTRHAQAEHNVTSDWTSEW